MGEKSCESLASLTTHHHPPNPNPHRFSSFFLQFSISLLSHIALISVPFNQSTIDPPRPISESVLFLQVFGQFPPPCIALHYSIKSPNPCGCDVPKRRAVSTTRRRWNLHARRSRISMPSTTTAAAAEETPPIRPRRRRFTTATAAWKGFSAPSPSPRSRATTMRTRARRSGSAARRRQWWCTSRACGWSAARSTTAAPCYQSCARSACRSTSGICRWIPGSWTSCRGSSGSRRSPNWPCLGSSSAGGTWEGRRSCAACMKTASWRSTSRGCRRRSPARARHAAVIVLFCAKNAMEATSASGGNLASRVVPRAMRMVSSGALLVPLHLHLHLHLYEPCFSLSNKSRF